MNSHRVLITFLLLFLAPIGQGKETTSEIPAGLEKALQQARHKIEVADEKGKVQSWQTVNPKNHLNITFDGNGIDVASTRGNWHFGMELTGIGAPEQLKPVNKPTVTIKDNRLSYDRGEVDEWYINDPKGLEQGFTLNKPLSQDQLVLQFELRGDLKAAVINDGDALVLESSEGKRLRYEGLKAWDAKGRDLGADMQVQGNSLQLVVAVTDAAYPITIDPWLVEDQKLMASDAAPDDQFGYSVAVSGNTAAVGAYKDDDGGNVSGSAYVFTRNAAGIWTEQAKLTASDAAPGDYFGYSVAVSDNTVVVGAHWDDDMAINSGSVYVYARSGSSWVEQAKLTASDPVAHDNFGYSVAVSDETVVLGARFGHNSEGVSSGSAYVFTRSGTNWSEQAKLTTSDAAHGDQFGYSVALSGNTAVVGAYLNGGGARGSAYIFERNEGSWIEQAKLTASDVAISDYFGISVAVSGDVAVVGAHGAEGVNLSTGAAYVFVRNGINWVEQAKLMAAEREANAYERFGNSVAVSGDTVVVGAPQVDEGGVNNTGLAYIFIKPAGGWSGDLTETSKLVASDAHEHAEFGYSVAVSGDTAVVGAYKNRHDGGLPPGSAYVFKHASEITVTLTSPNSPDTQNPGDTPTLEWTSVFPLKDIVA